MFLLCIRGTMTTQENETARKIHNETAGSDAGVAAARALGDLSHKVYVPATQAGDFTGGKPGEFLILDVWKTAEGIQTFFSDKQVQQAGTLLFANKDPAVAMPAKGAHAFHLQAPMNRPDRYVGLIRGTVKSVETAIAAISEGSQANLSTTRQRGQLSHELFVKLGPPSSDGSAEIIGVDLWANLDGMLQTYKEHTAALMPLFKERPAMSVWTQPPGAWVEW